MLNWHVISISPPQHDVHWNRCIAWCEKNISAYEWFYQGEGVFEFKHERDYLWFILKWQ